MLRRFLWCLLLALLFLTMGCRHISVLESEVRGSLRDKYDHAFNWVEEYNGVRVPEIAIRQGDRRVLGIDARGEAAVGEMQAHKTVLSFIHLSDVQLRDERIRLNGRRLSRLLDRFAPVTEYGEEQQQYDSAVYLALVKTLNQYAKSFEVEMEPEEKRQFPLFLAHTGDAVHAGVLQELYEYLWISSKLELPWLQVIGNHDTTAFGTKLFKVQLRNPRLGFFPLYDSKLFMHMHGHSATNERLLFSPGVYIAPAQTKEHAATVDFLEKKYHGFDLDAEEEQQVGYYTLIPPHSDSGEEPFADRKDWWEDRLLEGFQVRFLFLDTTASGSLHRGGIDEQQLKWLREELELAQEKGEHVVAFGHHDLGGGFVEKAEQVTRLFAQQPGFLGYFCGHTHKQEMRMIKVKGDATAHFWQIIGPPVVEWPQAGLFARLVQLADHRLAWDLTPFTHGYQRRSGETDQELNPDAADPAARLRAQVIRGSESAKEDYTRGDSDQEMRQPPLRLLLPANAVHGRR